MARRSRTQPAALTIALALAATVLLAACGSPTATLSPVPGTPGSAPPAALASPVTGRLTKIEAEGLTRVKGFTMRLDDGTEIAFVVGPLENGAEFPPGHLAEHMSTSSAVRVFFRDEGGAHTVYRLEDGE